MYVSAETTTESDSISIPESETFVRIEDGDYICYYGYTGDRTTADDIDEDVTVVNSQDDYYSLFESSKANKDIATTGAPTLPSFVDNSTSKYFPAIGDQGGLGSCTFWAQVYYQFTYMMNREMDVEVKDLPFEFESLYSDSLTNVVGNEITFTNKRENKLWLDGDSYCRNYWGNLTPTPATQNTVQ